MLLKLEKLIAKYNMKITGVIQAGAHWGEEVDDYIKNGITYGHLFEPDKENFQIMKKAVVAKEKEYGIKYPQGFGFIDVALGSSVTVSVYYKEKKNHGQSNSLLMPKVHTEYYPDITFDETEKVLVFPIDYFDFKSGKHNFLVLDVQGYELEVLKGATETLKHIDYIYTEVNREELYENCAMVEDLDNYLTDFRRVETKWKRKGFGDALYIANRLL